MTCFAHYCIYLLQQEVLIAFGPFVRSGNPNAFKIHQEYLVHTNQREFINAARQFLIEQQRNPPVVEKTVPTSVAQTAGRNDNGTLNDNSVGRTVNGGNSTHGNNVLPLQNDAAASNAINGSTPKPVLAPPPLPPPPGLHAPSQYAKTDVTQGSMHPMSAGEHRNIAPARAPPGMGQPLPAATSGPPNLSPNLHHGPPPGIPPHLQTPPSETNNNAEMPNAKKDTPSILPAALTTPAKESKPAPAATPSKPLRVRRTQTRLEEQPGRLFANEIPAAAPGSTASFNNHPPTLSVRPRSELTARWVLPLTYLRDRALRRFEEERATSQAGRSPQNLTIRDALKYLAVGLFRRGASDNGAQSSIVSKEILGPDSGEDENGRPAKDYPFGIDQRTDSVFGTVPFYAPRTPGNVVFRLYFEDEAHVTLATGPCVSIIPAESDYDQVLRFILSNFKSKKGTVGVSSMHSLASVLELFSPARSDGQYARNYFDSAGRVAWGCICESRKVVELAALTYAKKKKQLEEQKEIEENNEKMLQLELVRSDSTENESSDTNGGGQDKTASNDSKSKYAMEEHTNERKWKEIQLAYAHVLKV